MKKAHVVQVIVIAFAVLVATSLGVVTAKGASRPSGRPSTLLLGSVVAAESGQPLVSGMVSIGDRRAAIRQGEFTLSGLKTGKARLLVEGPFRQSTTVEVEIRKGDNRVALEVPCSFPASEVDQLAKITHAEAGGEPFEGQVAVAASILNRVKDPKYPSSISAVVYQVLGGRYQYSPVANGSIHRRPSSSAYLAAYAALAGEDPTNGATGFYNPAKTRDRWVREHPVMARIGQHVFFKY